MANNYTLGRGELHFDRFTNPVAMTLGGERYLGNSPEFSATIESENLDHYNSDRGVREKDESIVLQTNRTASFITDNISPENLALFFFGTSEIFATTGATVSDEPLNDVKLGLTYQLGMSPTNPSGLRNVTGVTVSKGVTALVLNTDYTLDAELGRITLLATSATVHDGDDLTVDYTHASATRERVISGSQAVGGALRFISYNPQGKRYDWYMPYVKLSPNGDFTLKGDEWQQIPFTVEILKKPGYEAIYIDGRPL